MGIESHVRLTELAPSLQQALTRKLQAEGIDLSTAGMTMDPFGRVYFFGLLSQYVVDYLHSPVNPEDGTYDTGDKAVVRKQV